MHLPSDKQPEDRLYPFSAGKQHSVSCWVILCLLYGKLKELHL